MYYPKSQILENQYANPGELYDSSTGKIKIKEGNIRIIYGLKKMTQ